MVPDFVARDSPALQSVRHAGRVQSRTIQARSREARVVLVLVERERASASPALGIVHCLRWQMYISRLHVQINPCYICENMKISIFNSWALWSRSDHLTNSHRR